MLIRLLSLKYVYTGQYTGPVPGGSRQKLEGTRNTGHGTRDTGHRTQDTDVRRNREMGPTLKRGNKAGTSLNSFSRVTATIHVLQFYLYILFRSACICIEHSFDFKAWEIFRGNILEIFPFFKMDK